MSDQDGFMTHAEMRDHFPGRPKLELVILVEHDGEHMWSKDAAGWWRLDDKPRQ